MRKENYEERNSKGNVNKTGNKSNKSSSQRSNSRNSNNRRKFDQSRKDGKSVVMGAEIPNGNDPAFYNKYPTILNQVGKVNNYHPVGLIGKDMFGPVTDTSEVRGIPGIAAMNIIPAIPVASSGASTLQQSAYQTWTKVRDSISGTRSYDPVDLQLMSIAVSQAVSCATWLKRFFNFAYTMSPFNRYAPERLFQAMHCDYQDFIAEIPAYRARYNRITINLSRIYANTENNYHKMLRSMFAGVLAEPGANGQLYVYNPCGFYKYAWTTDDKGVKVGSLVFTGASEVNREEPMGSVAIKKLSIFLDLYEMLVDALITDGDVNTMSGDILKTYGEASQVMLPLALETDSDLPQVSLIDLAQFQMSYVPMYASSFSNYKTIIQSDAAYIKFQPKLSFTKQCWPCFRYDGASGDLKELYKQSGAKEFYVTTQRNRILLNDYVDLNQPANVAEVLRNVPIIADYSKTQFEELIVARQGEATLDLDVMSTTGILPHSLVVYYLDKTKDVEDLQNANILSVHRNFTFLPMRLFFDNAVNSQAKTVTMTELHIDANLNDYYSLSRQQVAQIHDVMALSMFSDL